MKVHNLGKALLSASSLAAGLLIAQSAGAAPVTCSASNNPSATTPQLPGCTVVPGTFPNTAWVNPAQAPGTPGENEPLGEQVMTLHFGLGSTFSSPSGATQFYIANPGGSAPGDLITLTTAPVTGGTEAELIFASDPPNPNVAGATQIGTENAATGFVGRVDGVVFSQLDGTRYTVLAASDGEQFFDPFGFGADTSDGLRVNAVPEPASLALLGVGLAGLGLIRRKRA